MLEFGMNSQLVRAMWQEESNAASKVAEHNVLPAQCCLHSQARK